MLEHPPHSKLNQKSTRALGTVGKFHTSHSPHQWLIQIQLGTWRTLPVHLQNGFRQKKSWTMKHQALTPRSILINQHSYVIMLQDNHKRCNTMHWAQENPKKMDSPKKCLPLLIILYNMLMSGLTITQVCRRRIHNRHGCTSQRNKYLIQAMTATSNSCQKQTSPLWQMSLSHSPANSSWETKILMESSQSHSI